ncbi:uncharacterized protein LOC116971597 [Amblyraja radiata]|uniref:uncharacterized protein LOC116971597 n=1 Tax=Amblyraja radiata TaxID=386614 RepID=UPI0014027F3D|nr:uncharacterized protein LOC116971597 [Amblyraja radiata]
MQHGADPYEKNNFGNCAMDLAVGDDMKSLIKIHPQRRKVTVKVGGNQKLIRNMALKNTVDNKKLEVRKNDKMATRSGHVLDISASLKRKTESTHQSKSDVQPNKKTQSTGTKCNINENQPKHIDVEQPQGKPVTHDMVETRAQFATHSGQEITQSDFFGIQSKSASTTVNEAVTKPAVSSVSLQHSVVIGNTTVPQTSLIQAAKSRNSISDFTVKTEDNSVTFKYCQSVLFICHTKGSNIERLVCKDDKMATMSSHVLDISASHKKETESTHQAKSDVQPKKKTQSTGTKRNINKNQPKNIDVDQPQRRLGPRSRWSKRRSFRAVCKNDKTAIVSRQNLGTAESVKRKTESTHQAQSDAQPNKKTQSTGTKRNVNKNQPKHIDVEQPQGKHVTHDMVESQAQFATHSGQEFAQSDYFEIQTKSASTTVNEAVTKPAGSNVSLQDPVVIGNTNVPQTSQRLSTRSRNSISRFTEENSAPFKQCQSVLPISHAEGSNIERLVCKNDKMATMSSHVLDISASLKRKTESTHQSKSDVQPKKKTQSTGTKRNINKNQPKNIDVEQPQRRLGPRSRWSKRRSFRAVCKNDKTAIVSRQNLGTAESVKRKTESTHQAQSDAQPNKKTQTTGTKRNVNKNQPKHIDVEQPQGKPVTHDMVESQAQFATHSGQEIAQSDFFEIQTKSASTTVNEVVPKPAGSNVSLQDPVVIGNTTVPQTSQRLSTRSRNTIIRFTEENSATFKQCHSVLPISHAEGSNIERLVCKNDKMATMSSHVLDISASLKRKTESTHQAKSGAQPKKKTQSTGTKRNINKNQPKNIDVEQPQRRPKTLDMVELQAQFATHSGQEITQSNSFEIQSKSASTTVNEIVTKPASVGFQNPVVIGNTTVPQTSLKQSGRTRNSFSGFTVQAEDNSARSKQCQSVLPTSHPEGSNIEGLVCKNDKTAIVSRQNLGRAESVKRKAESTHQAKSDAQPNKKTQSTGTKRNVNKNQPKHIDVEQPQGKPVTRDMVESQAQFATHSVNEAVTKPAETVYKI